MSGLTAAARAALGAPGIENVDGQLHLLVPVVNMGEAALSGLEVHAVKLGGAARLSPAAFPVVLGMLEARSAASFAVRFAGKGLVAGKRYLLSLVVNYTFGNVVHCLQLNRHVRIPAPSPVVVAPLHARVTTVLAQNTWRYTLHNDEAPDSGLYVSSLALMISAPVMITGTPPGWRGETDGISYVFWRAADYLHPYPNHVMPGQALAGFRLNSPHAASQASAAAMSSWNHTLDAAGPVLTADAHACYVLTPYRS
ncbi:hypothetical protein GJV26_15260 [Massilia dura]|uniref:Uncharacterized protein n=1 Tax=Pseudoduganella dura TaxID=321982 RepID=A0A6I3XJE0_9BURK|nr:hypothetical protein [Pseudoduganella dura]MUI13801.1 hypothetical protein [Pseudoduganella dura]GGY10995.1 hypothetical protein GCM10007386_46660 [Pseudoduganella dura]